MRNALPGSLALAGFALVFALVTAGCPQPPHKNQLLDGGVVFDLPDAGAQQPSDGGVDDAGFAIPADAGTPNTAVRIESVSPPTGPLSGLEADGTQHRVLLRGDGFTPNARVFFDDVEADTVIPVTLPSAITVHPNCTSPGIKTIRVYDELGVGVSCDPNDPATACITYTCFSPITIASISPASGTTDGGDVVTITGTGFTAATQGQEPTSGMVVTLGGRQVVNLVVDSETQAHFTTPPGAAGRVDVTAIDAFGRSQLPLGFTYVGALRLASVTPEVVDDNGAVVELDGQGFVDDVAATIGGQPAARNNLISDARLRVVVPAGLSGPQDVAVTRGADTALLPGALVVRPPLAGALTVTAAVPPRADTAGGDVVTLVGEGFTGTTAVTVGGTAATAFTVVDDRTISLTVPAGPVGAAPVVVTTGAGSATLNGFAWYAPVVVTSVTPASGPVAGGTAVTIAGRGFVDPATVTFGGIPADGVVVVGDGEITATTPAGASGPVDVVVQSNGERGVLAGGYRFDAPVTVIGVDPPRGGMGGFTLVTVTGTGFTKGTPSVFFGDPANPVSQAIPTDVHVLNDSTLTCLTPPGQPGIVDVTVQVAAGAETESATATAAYTYFLPTAIVGGAGGGPIEGSLYVSVLDAVTGSPVPGMLAWIGTGDQPVAAGLTDVNGQATISSPQVFGPQTVTVAGDCFSTVSWVDIDANELTAFVFPTCGGPPSGGGTPPPPPPPAKVRGHVFGFAKEFFDPAAIDQSGCTSGPPAKCEVALAEVTTTTPDEFSGNPPFLPDSVRQVFAEGDPYFLDGTRTGRLALIAIAGIADVNNETFRFRQMGIRRAVFPQHGVELDNQDIELTIPLDDTIDLSLPDAPLRPVDDTTDIGFMPTITRVIPFIHLGGEGSFVYTQAVEGKRNHVLEPMPEVPGPLLTFISGAYTTDGRNLITEAGAVNLTQGDTLVTNTGVTTWSTDSDFDGLPDIDGNVFVTETPDGKRFASIVQGCEHPQGAGGPDTTTCGDGDSDGEVWIQLQEPATFTSTAPQAYHIGTPGTPQSEVIQDGLGNLRGGVTIQPVLGLPQLVSPLENGVLTNRTLRWKAAPGQQPSIHDMFLFEPFGLSTIWEIYDEGTRTKVVVPVVPELDAIERALPDVESACVADPTISQACAFFGLDPSGQKPYVPPGDMAHGGMAWQHQALFIPGEGQPFDYNDWSLLTISGPGRRAWTTDLHIFLHGDDN